MNGKNKLGEISLDQFGIYIDKKLKNIPPDHFMKAAKALYWDQTKQLGVEITRKDVTNIPDINCISKTFDFANNLRIKQEKKEEAFLTETIKRRVNLVFLIAALASSFFALLKS